MPVSTSPIRAAREYAVAAYYATFRRRRAAEVIHAAAQAFAYAPRFLRPPIIFCCLLKSAER